MRCQTDDSKDFTNKPKSTFKDHAGPVTGICVHPGVAGTEDGDEDPNWRKIQDKWGDLILSSSTDWTVRLWNYNSKMAGGKVASIVHPSNMDYPLT